MKKILSLCIALLLVLSLFNFQSVFAGNNSEVEVVDGELIVSFEVGDTSTLSILSTSSDKTALENLGLTVKESLTDTTSSNNGEFSMLSNSNTKRLLSTMGSVYLVSYDKEKYANVNSACKMIKKQLEKDGYSIKYVEPNYVVRASNLEIQPCYYINPNQEWNYNMINAPEAWNTTIGNSNVKIAVIDTGIDLDHGCLENYIDRVNSITYVGTTADDGNGHGTHVAGIIASYGTVSGVMRVGTLMAVRVLDASGSGSTINVMNGIIHATDCGADAINMSLAGGSYSSSMQNACTYAYNSGTALVAPSGNDSASTVSYPAKYENVLCVGAVTSTRARASYSNYGIGLDVMAPGSSIYSTYMGGGFAIFSSTSMASPHVVGLVGLMKAANPSATIQEILSVIGDTAVLDSGRTTTQYGNGIIDCEAAVLEILNY